MSVIERERVAVPVTEAERVRDVLREAKGLVAAGWFRCDPHYATGNFPQECIATALESVTGWDSDYDGPKGGAMRLLGFSTWEEMIAWNNDPTRTQAEVVALFDEALAATRAEQEGR